MSIDGSDAFVSCTHEVMTMIIPFMFVLVWFGWDWENRCLQSVAVFSFLIEMSPVFFLPWYQNTTIRWSDRKCTLHYMGCCVGGRSKVGALCWRNGGSTEYDWYHCWRWGGHLDLQPSLCVRYAEYDWKLDVTVVVDPSINLLQLLLVPVCR